MTTPTMSQKQLQKLFNEFTEPINGINTISYNKNKINWNDPKTMNYLLKKITLMIRTNFNTYRSSLVNTFLVIDNLNEEIILKPVLTSFYKGVIKFFLLAGNLSNKDWNKHITNIIEKMELNNSNIQFLKIILQNCLSNAYFEPEITISEIIIAKLKDTEMNLLKTCINKPRSAMHRNISIYKRPGAVDAVLENGFNFHKFYNNSSFFNFIKKDVRNSLSSEYVNIFQNKYTEEWNNMSYDWTEQLATIIEDTVQKTFPSVLAKIISEYTMDVCSSCNTIHYYGKQCDSKKVNLKKRKADEL